MATRTTYKSNLRYKSNLHNLHFETFGKQWRRTGPSTETRQFAGSSSRTSRDRRYRRLAKSGTRLIIRRSPRSASPFDSDLAGRSEAGRTVGEEETGGGGGDGGERDRTGREVGAPVVVGRGLDSGSFGRDRNGWVGKARCRRARTGRQGTSK